MLMISKEDLEVIRDLLVGSAKDAEDMYCEYNGDRYNLESCDGDTWIDDGKYQFKNEIFELFKNGEGTEVFYGQGVTRSGSYYTDYYYEYESLREVKMVEKTIVVKKWVDIEEE